MIAFAVRMVATVFALGAVGTFAFLSGWVVFSTERPGFGRHVVVDWACPSCELWATAYVSRFWRETARRRALGLAHRRLSPRCGALDSALIIVDLHKVGLDNDEKKEDHEVGIDRRRGEGAGNAT
jgi:hypothetical protein